MAESPNLPPEEVAPAVAAGGLTVDMDTRLVTFGLPAEVRGEFSVPLAIIKQIAAAVLKEEAEAEAEQQHKALLAEHVADTSRVIGVQQSRRIILPS